MMPENNEREEVVEPRSPILEVWLTTVPGYDLRAELTAARPVDDHPYEGSLAEPRENKRLNAILQKYGGFDLEPAFADEDLFPMERAAVGAHGPDNRPPVGRRELRAAITEALRARNEAGKGGGEIDEKEVRAYEELLLNGSREDAVEAVDSFRGHVATLYPYFRVRLLWDRAAGSDVLDQLREVPGILDVEEAPLLTTDAAFVPADPLYNAAAGGPDFDRSPREVFDQDWMPKLREQWNLALIEAEAGWAGGTQGAGVTVGIIDSGIDSGHRDLKDRLHPDSDTVLNIRPQLGGGPDPHGTLVAGIVGASSNRRGVTGIAPRATLLACTKGGKPRRSGRATVPTLTAWVAAMIRAVNSGAKVINCSWHAEQPCCAQDRAFAKEHMLKEAVLHATRNGAVVVCSVGNDSHHGLPRPYRSWPAALDGEVYKGTRLVVISVGGVDKEKVRFPGSNYGPFMTVMAPGYEVPSTDLSGEDGLNDRPRRVARRVLPWFNDYAPFGGTSAAAAHVSGVVALMLSAVPSTTPAEARAHIIATAEKIGPLSSTVPRHDEYGYGLVRARAVARAAATVALRSLMASFDTLNSRDVLVLRHLRDRLLVRSRAGQAFAVGLAAVTEDLQRTLARGEVARLTLQDLRALYDAIEIATGCCRDKESGPLSAEVVLSTRDWRRVLRMLRRLERNRPSRALQAAINAFREGLAPIRNLRRARALELLGADEELIRLQRWAPRLDA